MQSDIQKQLDEFFIQHQQQAYKMAYVLTQNRDDALELVQDSMLKLVQKYTGKPAKDWPMLFYRILQNRIHDFHRRQRLRSFLPFLQSDTEQPEYYLKQHGDIDSQQPDQAFEQSHAIMRISEALKTLPLRQQQTFMLRAWQQFNTREAAFALSISEGSVKTHYHRAVAQLREILGDQL